MIFLDVWLNGLDIHGTYNAICLLKDYNEFCIILVGKNHNYVKCVFMILKFGGIQIITIDFPT